MKKHIITNIRLFVLLFSICLILSTVFIVDNTLANGVVSAKYFWFYGAMGILSVVTFAAYSLQRNVLKVFPVDILLLSVTGLALLTEYALYRHSAITTKWILLLLLVFLYVFFRISLQTRQLRFYVLLFFISTGFIEAVWGLRQLYGFIPSNHTLFLTTGSFFNSGPYSGYLATIAPLALFFVLRDSVVFKHKFNVKYLLLYTRDIIAMLTLVAIVLVLPATMSRASWIAAIVGCTFILFFRFAQKSTINAWVMHHRTKAVTLLVIALVVATAAAAGTYRLKKDSADGRALIWKTSLQVIAKHPMGVGIGHFPHAYGQEQAAYFASGQTEAQEELVAGNPEYAFNEYLQIFIEFGVMGALGLFVVFIALIYTGIKRKMIAETGGLLSLLMFASMSYPFSLLPVLIMLVLFMALIVTENDQIVAHRYCRKGILLRWKTVVPLLLFSCSLIFAILYLRYPTYNAYKEWNKLKMIGSADTYPETKTDYEKLYPYLSDQTPFLFEYAQCLSKAGEYEKSNRVLEQAVRISCDPMLYNIMGKNYQQLKNYQAAEQNFLMASHLVPPRIYPYYLLAKLYAEKGDTLKALRIAHKVLLKEPKVQSTAIQEMKEEMRILIKARRDEN